MPHLKSISPTNAPLFPHTVLGSVSNSVPKGGGEGGRHQRHFVKVWLLPFFSFLLRHCRWRPRWRGAGHCRQFNKHVEFVDFPKLKKFKPFLRFTISKTVCNAPIDQHVESHTLVWDGWKFPPPSLLQ